jgi:hypothetical protein
VVLGVDMADERMPSRQYAKYEKVFFLYGSCSKMVAPVRPDEWRALAEEMWSWAIVKVSALVDEYTEEVNGPPSMEETPPVVETPPQESAPKASPLKQKKITVKTVAQVKSGERNGAEWILSRITDTNNVAFTTFAGHRYKPGGVYTIQYEESQNGKYMNRNIKEPKDREPADDEEDIPF